MKKTWFGAAALLLVAATPSFAQTVVSQSTFLMWDIQTQPGIATAADAQALSMKYYIDMDPVGKPLTVLPCVPATAPVNGFTCSAPFPAVTPGRHDISIAATNAAGESPRSNMISLTFVAVPLAPSTLRIQTRPTP